MLLFPDTSWKYLLSCGDIVVYIKVPAHALDTYDKKEKMSNLGQQVHTYAHQGHS